MPQRFLRPGIRNSDRWNSVSRDAQITYLGILTLVDDYGQYDARPSLLCAEIFAIWNDLNPENRVDSAALRRILQQLAAKKLIEIYDCQDGKSYLQVTQWQERVREGAKRKWGGAGYALRSAAESCGILPPTPTPTPTPSPTPSVNGEPVGLSIFDRVKILKQELGKWFNTNPETSWPHNEEQLMALIVQRDDFLQELDLLRNFKVLPESFFTKTSRTTLEKWHETVQRANDYEQDQKLNARTRPRTDNNVGSIHDRNHPKRPQNSPLPRQSAV